MVAKSKPVDWDELYPGRFIKAGELKGKRWTLTISDVDIDSLVGDDGKEKTKGIITFKETTKQIPLNKTNGLCIRAMFGRKLSEWLGKRVIIFPGTWSGEDASRVWGSPDIAAPMDVEIKLPRRKEFTMQMHTSEKEAA